MMNTKFQSFGFIVGMALLVSGCASTNSSNSKSTVTHIKSGIYSCPETWGNLKVQKVNNQTVKIMEEDDSDAQVFHFDKQLGKFKSFVDDAGTQGYVYTQFLPNQMQMGSSAHNQTITCQFKQAK